MRKPFLILVSLLLLVGVAGATINDYNSSLGLLLHQNQSPANPTYFNDSSITEKIGITYGNTITRTDVKKFGNASGYFDGNGDYLAFPDDAAWDMSANDIWTSVFWFNFTALPGSGVQYPVIVQNDADTDQRIIRIIESGGSHYWDIRRIKASPSIDLTLRSSAVTPTTNAWHQIAVIHNATTYSMYQDGVLILSSTSTTDNDNIAARLKIGTGGIATPNYYSGYMDELAIWDGVAIPIADLYPQIDEIGYYNISIPVANFTCTPTTAMLGESIACTDTSSDTPTNWTYYWGDGNVTDGTQNPSYTYPFIGTFSINQTVNNTLGSSWYNRSNYITITNVSGFTQQDLWQTGHYTKTLHITDSATNAPIPVVVVTDSNGQSYTTTNGTAYFTEDAGTVVFYFAATGYVSKSQSFIIDGDSTDTVQMVAVVPSTPPSIVYIPQQVRFQLVGTDGFYLSNVFIQATPINFTAPSNWTETLLGIAPGVGIRDTTVYGTTGSDGSWVAPMLQSFQYQINLTRASDVNYNFTLYPQVTEYRFTIPVAGFVPVSTPSNVVSYSLQNATINATFQFINMTYNDGSLNTDYLSFVVYDVNSTLVYSQNYTGSSANAQNFSYVQQCSKGQAYTYGFQANQSAYGWINQSSTIKLISQVELLKDGPSWIPIWIAIVTIVVFGTIFMIFSKPFALIGIPLLTWAFQYIFGFLPATFLSNIALGCMLTIGVLVYIRQAENKIQ